MYRSRWFTLLRVPCIASSGGENRGGRHMAQRHRGHVLIACVAVCGALASNVAHSKDHADPGSADPRSADPGSADPRSADPSYASPLRHGPYAVGSRTIFVRDDARSFDPWNE